MEEELDALARACVEDDLEEAERVVEEGSLDDLLAGELFMVGSEN